MDYEQRIARLEERLANAEKEYEDTLYAISHDLKAPLRSIMSASMIVIEDYGDQIGEEGKRELKRGYANARKIEGLMNEILKISRLNRSPINADTVDVSAIAEQVATTLAATVDPRPNVEIQPGLTAHADPGHVRIILEALIDNAIKFSPKDRVAHVQVGEQEGVFFVRDTGIGFLPDQAERIFRPFERLNGDEHSGPGMGLPTARMLAHRYGGKVWGEGKEGEGATFWVKLGE